MRRDAGGNFSAGTITANGNLELPSTASGGAAGVLMQGGGPLLHTTAGNVFLGGNTGNVTTLASSNTGLGSYALTNLTTGNANTAVGDTAMITNTGGTSNSAVGYAALQNNGAGNNNVALGFRALRFNTSGSNNIALGANAGSNLTTGSQNIDLGHAGVAGESGVIRIGTAGTHTATFIAGVSGVLVGNAAGVVMDVTTGQLGTISSSRRYKENINDMGDASARLLALRPVTFRYKQPCADGEKPVQFGLIAEEVAESFPELAVFNARGEPETVKYQELAPLLLNEVQKQQRRADAKEAELRQLKKESAELRQESADLRARLEKLEAALQSSAK